MHKKFQNFTGKLTSKHNKRCSSANGSNTSSVGAVTSLIFVGTLSSFMCINVYNIYNPVSNVSAASTISVTSSGAQSIDVVPDSSSSTGIGTSIGVDEITVNTTCKAGYNFSISTSVNDNNLYLNGSSSNNASDAYFNPSTGTTALLNSPNTWGYYYNSPNPTIPPTSSNTFSPVPTVSSTAAIIKTPSQTASTTDISDSFNIYYGVAASSTLTPGTYKMIPDTNNSNADGSITYYVTMGTNCDKNIITYNPNGGSGSIADQYISEGSTATLADNSFTRTNHYFMGWSTNQNATSPEYRTNQTITPTGDMTLYAVWGDSTATSLYDAVASLTKGTQANDANTVANTGNTVAGIQAAITKANSGVYTYNSSVFGASSDASNDNPIYYYRGILDNVTGTYGSDGDAMDYPNYVKLASDDGTTYTCWRIVRTTGDGGAKMIYNGMYGNTTSGSCANSRVAAAIRSTSATAANSRATFTSAFDATANSSGKSIVGVGYTYNASYKSTTTATAYSTLFGTNSSYSGNSTNSTIKGNIETWFTNNINSYASKLEPSAGYCNDRTLNTGTSWTSPMSDSATVSTPYSSATSGNTVYYFGAYIRNTSTTKAPSLTCTRNNADLYTTSSASNGNKQLSKPVALLTADEMSFAGSGRSTASQGSSYHANSYLRSGSSFWLLSPYARGSNGSAYGFSPFSNGDLNGDYVDHTNGVRPAISLKSGTTISSGSGTATDPWVVTPPPATMQNLDSSLCTTTPSTVVDSRDGTEYTIQRLADGNCWMLDNIALDLTSSSVQAAMYNSTDTQTHASYTTLGYLFGKATGSSPYTSTAVANWTSSYSYTAPLIATSGSGNLGDWAKDTVLDARYGAGSGKVGVYYNYCAASAGSYCYASSSSSGNAAEDICPSGWRMPTGGSSGEFNTLYSKYNTTQVATNTASLQYNLSTPLSGYFDNGSAGKQGSYGRWWSSTRGSNDRMCYLRVDASSVLATYGIDRYFGHSMRCVLGS